MKAFLAGERDPCTTSAMSTRLETLNLKQIQPISVRDHQLFLQKLILPSNHYCTVYMYKCIQMSEDAVLHPKGCYDINFSFNNFDEGLIYQTCFLSFLTFKLAPSSYIPMYSPFQGCLVSAVALHLPEIRRGHFLWISLRLIFIWDAL